MKSKDKRRARLPPEGDIAGPRMKDYTSDRSVAIIQRPSSPDPQCGSATCVALGDRWFLVTAAHNIDYLPDDREILLLPRGERSHPGIPFLARSHPRPVPYPFDVAWIELDPAVARRSGLLAVPLSQLSPVHQIPRPHFIQGYPSREVTPRGSGSFDPLSMCVGVTSVQPIDSNAAIGLEYPPNDPEDAGLELVHPEGFSGGGVWTFHGLKVWPHLNPEGELLVAVLTEYCEQKLTLDAVSIEAWINLLAADHPELGIHVQP